MMRNELDISHDRPSRLSRVAVIFSTLGVAVIAAWVFVPILLANYTNYAATVAAGPKPRVVAERPVVVAPAAPPAAPATDTTAVASPEDDATPPSPGGFNSAGAVPWPVPAAPPAPAPADTMRLASAEPATATQDAGEVVPLPRKRPSHTIAARLAIPLPRPRPEIENDVPPAELSAFERQVERMR
jgi:hypothetical protein